ncbi:MAG: homoaconitase [Candidatus Marinimicrobia bacterium]|jgi:homoaconitate hydratase|nr:homoaconitase [Candidatus Neomarinimicrobiota bacterium]MBT3618016.1 homoaconitase [Candidatus Neomarinimicrobiota bacterium]MBT3828527.1 homoaconitase [Candidatus Neomarinimicrobiota bacterium]MBT3998002.1 homoaconitase [Candidatus Neomarinimicrobiota bacterium]MBT4280294.1 homoaconitase [Candidatus Neomarinimicrobiota bacterium]
MSQNLVEKIAQKYTVDLPQGIEVHSGDYISIQPEHILTHDNTAPVSEKFKSIGAARIAIPRQPMFALDHNVQDTSSSNMKKYTEIETFAEKMGVDFYPAGRGIGHQVMCEEGYAFPGTMAVASDSHANMYGGLGCLGTPVVRTDAAAIWATGRTWWQIPTVAKVELTGKISSGVTGKDVIITLAGVFNHDEVLNHALEFSGEGINSLSINDRLTIANMTTEWGALVGLFPIDDVTIQWLRNRAEFISKRGLEGVPSDEESKNGEHPRINLDRIQQLEDEHLSRDAGAFYAKELTLNLSTVTPHVAGPDNVKTMTAVKEMSNRNISINKAYLVSCTNSRTDDLTQAAEIVRGRKVAKHVEFYIAAASSEVKAASEEKGDWQTLLAAGAISLPPGCGPCIGLGIGLLKDDEVGISATNRNFKGRMGSRSAKAYLASPAVVAASAIAGKITVPEFYPDTEPISNIEINSQPSGEKSSVSLLEGFPEKLSGELIFCHQDNLNTDGIYPGKYTYVDGLTPDQMAAVVMENYDPEFGKIVEENDILVSGFNFGSGSSREQAATSLKYRGIQLVIAGSFSQTYKRNALNNGYLVIEAPDLVKDLKEKFGTKKLTVKTGLLASIDFASSVLQVDDIQYSISAVGTAAQELILTGGLENWVKKRI